MLSLNKNKQSNSKNTRHRFIFQNARKKKRRGLTENGCAFSLLPSRGTPPTPNKILLLSQSALSTQNKQLENELGYSIIERNWGEGRGVPLTPKKEAIDHMPVKPSRTMDEFTAV